jgi:hypothetical protein
MSSTGTDWEQHYRDGHTPWDKGGPSPGLLDFLANADPAVHGNVMVPGCGLGHDVRALASSKGRPQVLGLDVSTSAVESAREFPVVAGESYVVGDWFDLQPSWVGAFDWVWEHTCFCAIEPELRAAYVESAHAALCPGGQLLGVFYLDPYDDEHRPGGGPPHGVEVEELVDYFVGDGRFVIEEKWPPQLAYPGREGLELMMRLRRSD